ncbi:MAG: exodeoxyribonuclease VII small subunit [Planctomycetales bacterium]|nr:exodeoxyribonuclease VII small subunit [Planctomycetales bacterium]
MAKKQIHEESGESPCFEESLAELEAVVADLEDGKLSLTDSLARYEEGIKHLNTCYQSLREVERKIELLAGLDESGQPIRQPFNDEATLSDERQQPRGRHRAATTGDSSSTGEASPTARGRKVNRRGAEASDDIDDSPGLF